MAGRWRGTVRSDGVIDGVDNLAAHVVQSYASLRPRDPQCFADLTAGSIDLLASMPYVMNLGPMPAKAGDTEQFQSNLRFALADRILSYPVLYPLLGPVGLTVFFFPGPNGKDLDNIFPLVVPTLLEQLHPLARRRTRMHSLTINSSSGTPCGADKPYPTNPTSRFIEALSLKGLPTRRDCRDRANWRCETRELVAAVDRQGELRAHQSACETADFLPGRWPARITQTPCRSRRAARTLSGCALLSC